MRWLLTGMWALSPFVMGAAGMLTMLSGFLPDPGYWYVAGFVSMFSSGAVCLGGIMWAALSGSGIMIL